MISSWGSAYPIIFPNLVFSLTFTLQAFILLTAPPSLLGHWKEDYYKEKLEWDSFKRFISDLDQLKKYNIKDIGIWQEWLIYATALGIGKQVSRSMRTLNINVKEAMFVPVMFGSFYGINSAINTFSGKS